MSSYRVPSLHTVQKAARRSGKRLKVLIATFGPKDLRTMFLEFDRNPQSIEAATKGMIDQAQKQQGK